MFALAFLLLSFRGVLVLAQVSEFKSRVHRDVETTQGVVRGYFSPAPPRYTYLGVPYGRPPTRRDRFKAPRPPQRWDGIFDAVHKIRCPQKSEGDENCLVVNVFTPGNASSLPVLVHVHGGGFDSGWGSHKPPLHLLDKDIIIVTFNYRIGALGFLCMGIPEASGNAGLKDQVAALYWIQRNIANFGGNPLDVTLYGTECGAVSVELLLLSKVTRGLFHKVILESGSALAPLAVTYLPLSTAFKTAMYLGYEGLEQSQELLSFYKDIPTRNLTNITDTFLPCIETESYYTHTILDVDPLEVLKNGNFDKVPMLIAYTDLSINNHMFGAIPDNFDNLLPNNLEFDNYKTKHRIAELVKEFYFDGDENISDKYVAYIQDLTTEYPIVKSTYLHAVTNLGQPVYLIKLLKNAYINTDVRNKFGNIEDFFYSTDDLSYTTGLIAETLVTFWSNFIKYSDPTPLTTSITPVIWEPVINEGTNSNIKINALSELIYGKSLTMSTGPLGEQLLFWDRIYDNFYKLHTSQLLNK